MSVKKTKSAFFTALLGFVFLYPHALQGQEVPVVVTVEVSADPDQQPISPYIFGKNNSLSDDPSAPLNETEWQHLRDMGIRMFRENGGNNSTKYNWRRKLTSHPDWYNNVFSHDWDYEAGSLQQNIPGAQGMWAFQLIGKAARSGSYNFSSWNYNQSQWWEGVRQNLCGGGTVNPDGGEEALAEGDTSLYLEHWSADSAAGILDHWFGPEGTGLDSARLRYWNMDNEPGIWSGTHDDVWPEQPDAEEFIRRYVEVALKARQRFPGIKLLGPVPANEWQWFNWDGEKVSYEGKEHVWLEYFIRRIAEEQQETGVRLLDVLDIHFYPTETDPAHIVQSHRVYFDREYDYPGANGVKRSGKSSWDNTITREYIFERCADWLERYLGPDHGITFAVSETAVRSGDPDVVANWYASMLGTFAGKGVELFTPWDWKTGMSEVVHLYSRHAEAYYTPASSSEEEFLSAYPTVNNGGDTMTIFLVNRHLDQPRSVELEIAGFPLRDGEYSLLQLADLPSQETFFSASDNALESYTVSAADNRIHLDLPPLSVSALKLFAESPDSEFGYTIVRAEAEEGELLGVQISSSGDGYSGSGYVTGLDSDGDQVTLTLPVTRSGIYKVVIRYRNSAGEKIQDVSVNGEFSFPVTFPNGSGFSRIDAGNHFMKAGSNSVTIRKSWGWTDIDLVELYETSGQEFQIDTGLVDPQAGPEVRNLYERLRLQFGHRIISGQTHDYFEELSNLAGSTPMLRAGDLSSYTEGYPYLWQGGGHTLGKDPDGSVEELIDWYQKTGREGIISFQWHWHSPTGGEAGQNNFYTENTDFDITRAVTPGTGENDDILRDIDDIALELQKFQEAGIPVLWRPLHEAGGGWFWWGAKGPEPCKQLYDLMFERLTNHHELHNLIWVWSTPEEDWYPGNDRVDIIGHDSYPGYYNYGNQKYAFDRLYELTGGKKLIAMTENGPIPDPEACLDQGAPWLYFMSWSDLVTLQNKTSHILSVFSHPRVVTLESGNLRTGSEWRSSLYPEDWKPGHRDAKGRFLHDFSHAGYQGGGVALPVISDRIVDITLPPYSADPSGTADVTAIIQQALDDVGASGGGVVYMPPGTYRLSVPSGGDHALVISYDSTILRGAGHDSSFLYNDTEYMRHREIIYVAPEYASWFSSAGTNTAIRTDLLWPTRVIPVKSVAGYQAGDRVIIRNTPTEAFIAEHGMTGMWTPEGIKGVAFSRRIDSVDLERDLLILDTPTRYALKTRDASRVYKARRHLQECGLEDFSMGNLQSSKSGWDEEDYQSAGTGAYDAHFSHAIQFEYCENSWVTRVHTYRPSVNTNDVHLLSNCLLMNMCRHMTIDSCNFQKPQYEGGGGNGYMYTLQSNDCLISNSRANHSRHNYDFKYPFSNGNVIHRCCGQNSKYSSDFHMYLSMANLFDVTTMKSDWLQAAFRPWGGPIHGHSSTQSVYYNTTGEEYHPLSDAVVESRQYGWGYVIGTSGPAHQVKTDPVAGTQSGYSYDSAPRDFVEGVGQGAALIPASLYRDQLIRRQSDTLHMNSYRVNVKVLHSETDEPVSSCIVEIYGNSQPTDGSGFVSFNRVPESMILALNHPRFHPIHSHQVVIHSDTTLTFRLQENSYRVELQVLDQWTLEPVSAVDIVLGEISGRTGQDGSYALTTFAGKQQLSLEKDTYRNYIDSVEIRSDTILQIPLLRTHATVKIWLKDGDTPLNQAIVSIGNDSVESNSLGLVRFDRLPVLQKYLCKVDREGYMKQSVEFYLRNDTSIHLPMEKIETTLGPRSGGQEIMLLPNPAGSYLLCILPAGHAVCTLTVTDLSGRPLIHRKVTENTVRFNLEQLVPGIYLLSASGIPYRRPVPFMKK